MREGFAPIRDYLLALAVFTLALLPNSCNSIALFSASHVCGDGVCELGEASGSCPADCGSSSCGNGACESGETADNCPADCASGTVCGNGICENEETSVNCPGDCGGSVCGNGSCELGETKITCPADCGGVIIDEAAHSTTVRVTFGKTILLVLHSTTWSIDGSSDPKVVSVGPTTTRDYPPGQNCSPGGGILDTTFFTRRVGSATISARRSECGDSLNCAHDLCFFTVSVVVE